jgi:peptidoglycan/xylan/chitin deacetylase (PgdA/CDA1 family)
VVAENSDVVNRANMLLGSRRTWGPHSPGILMYHAIARVADDPNRICVSPRRFEAQMRYLKLRGLRAVSVRELLRAAGTERARGLVGITFDDGYDNFLYAAMPILERFGFSATVFAVGGMLGAENAWDERPRMKLLGAKGIREAAKRGMEVGSHSMTHKRLSGLPTAQLQEEVADSRRVLGELLDEPVEGFCYPYGNLDGGATRAVRQAGYSYACACWTRAESNMYDLPRPPVWEIDGPVMLTTKLSLFPLYFKVTSRPTQDAVEEAGRIVINGTKYILRGRSKC